jgi:hypothetical protein
MGEPLWLSSKVCNATMNRVTHLLTKLRKYLANLEFNKIHLLIVLCIRCHEPLQFRLLEVRIVVQVFGFSLSSERSPFCRSWWAVLISYICTGTLLFVLTLISRRLVNQRFVKGSLVKH